jgi:hypothetical protein
VLGFHVLDDGRNMLTGTSRYLQKRDERRRHKLRCTRDHMSSGPTTDGSCVRLRCQLGQSSPRRDQTRERVYSTVEARSCTYDQKMQFLKGHYESSTAPACAANKSGFGA